jgi:hypothetical protein
MWFGWRNYFCLNEFVVDNEIVPSMLMKYFLRLVTASYPERRTSEFSFRLEILPQYPKNHDQIHSNNCSMR